MIKTGSTSRGRKTRAEVSDLRARLLRASIELIEEEGLQKLSLREVARRAGVTHQAPYHYFPDREALLGEICEEGFRLLTERMELAAGDQHNAKLSAAGRLAAVGQSYVEFACAYPAHFRIMFRPELVDHDHCPGAKAEGDRAFQTVARIVHETVKAGLPAVPSEAALITLCWSLSHGLACLVLDGPLAKKLPQTAVEQQVRDVTKTMRALLEASVASVQKAPKRVLKKPTPKRAT